MKTKLQFKLCNVLADGEFVVLEVDGRHPFKIPKDKCLFVPKKKIWKRTLYVEFIGSFVVKIYLGKYPIFFLPKSDYHTYLKSYIEEQKKQTTEVIGNISGDVLPENLFDKLPVYLRYRFKAMWNKLVLKKAQPNLDKIIRTIWLETKIALIVCESDFKIETLAKRIATTGFVDKFGNVPEFLVAFGVELYNRHREDASTLFWMNMSNAVNVRVNDMGLPMPIEMPVIRELYACDIKLFSCNSMPSFTGVILQDEDILEVVLKK